MLLMPLLLIPPLFVPLLLMSPVFAAGLVPVALFVTGLATAAPADPAARPREDARASRTGPAA